jgi:NADH-quinone oxidoreductase subunit L
MDVLVALIPVLPLAGFLFAVIVGPRLDRVPEHGHHGGHEGPGGHGSEPHGEAAAVPHAKDAEDEAHRASGEAALQYPDAHGIGAVDHADDPHGPIDDASFRSIPTEELQRATSPHAGHADDLANAEGAAGVIPDDLNDGRGQAGHVAPGAPRPTYRSWIVPTAFVGLSWILSMIVFAQVVFGHQELEVTIYEWIASGDFRIEISFFVDGLTAMLLLVVSTVGFLVHVYSIGYMDGDRGFWRFFAYLNLFMFSMLLLVLGDNFLMLYVGWEAVGLCSYALIGFWYKKPSAAGAAKKAFVVNRVGDFGFGLGIMMLWVNLGTLSFHEVFERIGELDEGTITVIALLLFAGAVGKSAQFPLHVWLPDAMEGPTPVSALIHAATMVNAGVYMVARANPIFIEAPTAMWVVAIIGTFTAIFAAAIALTQNDIKKVLAYSTVSQLAYMFMALGIGAWIAAIFHLVSHGFFKGLLFMGSGSVIHGAGGEQDMRFMGNLRARMPWTYRTMVIGSLALAGIPIFAGFFSKDEILAEAFNRGYLVFYLVGIVVAFMTAFYTFRMIFMTFWGDWRGPKAVWDHVHESATTMIAPLIILAVPTTLLGLVLGIPPEGGVIHTWLEEVFHEAEEAHAGVLPGSLLDEALSHGEGHHFELFGIGGLLLLVGALVAIGGVTLAYRWYVRRPASPERFVDRFPLGLGPGMYRASVNKYYVDDLYGLVWARGGVLFSNALWWFDAKIIDGAVNGAGWVASRVGGGLRKVQTGRVENYGLGIAAGLAVVLLVFATVVR